LEAAGLRDSEEPEVVGGPFLAERTGDLPLDCQMTERSLSRVVVPWNTVVVNKGKQRVLVPLKPLPISRRRVPRGNLTRDHVAIEVIDATAVFAEMTGLEAKPLNIFHERKQQVADSYNKPLELLVKRILPEIVIQISDQMDEAFLLPTGQRIVSSIKVGHHSAFETRQEWPQELRFTIWSQLKHHPNVVSKNPYMLVIPQDVHLRFIEMQDRPIQQFA